jgi:CHRD domain-containing protein
MTTAKYLGKLVLAASVAISATAAHAETLSFTADLLAVAGTDSKATGKVSADYDTDSKKLTWRGEYDGVTSYATSAGIYNENNQIVAPFRSVDSPFEGTAIVAKQQAPDLRAGRWFVLIRSAKFPNGELRGSLTLN